MAKHVSLKIALFLALLISLLYLISNKHTVIKEHLANPPPTLLSLQNENKELSKKVDDLNTQFEKMNQAGQQSADAAATVRAQASALKYSGAPTSPP